MGTKGTRFFVSNLIKRLIVVTSPWVDSSFNWQFGIITLKNNRTMPASIVLPSYPSLLELMGFSVQSAGIYNLSARAMAYQTFSSPGSAVPPPHPEEYLLPYFHILGGRF